MDGQRPRVLLAARPSAAEPLERVLREFADMVHAQTMDDAIAELERGRVDLVCCTLAFDESRMFDLLYWTRVHHACVPFVCARSLSPGMSERSAASAGLAARELGAAGFIDLPALSRQHGKARAAECIRQALVAALR